MELEAGRCPRLATCLREKGLYHNKKLVKSIMAGLRFKKCCIYIASKEVLFACGAGGR
jgi:hypothetical protein